MTHRSHPSALTLEVKHIDPLAAGFVDATSGITGTIDAIDVQATWNGQQLHVANLLIDTPKLTLVRNNKPTTVATPPPAPNSNDMLSTFTADHLQVKNGTFTITSPGQATPAVYQQLNAEFTNVSPTAAAPIQTKRTDFPVEALSPPTAPAAPSTRPTPPQLPSTPTSPSPT